MPSGPYKPELFQRAVPNYLADEYTALARTVTNGLSRFTLVPVECDQPWAVAGRILWQLSMELQAQKKTMALLWVDGDRSDLIERFGEDKYRAADVLVVLGFTGIPYTRDRKQGRPDIWKLLNQERSLIKKLLPKPVIFWCDPWVLLGLQEGAPDFYDFYTAHFRFTGPEGETEKQFLFRRKLAQMLGESLRPVDWLGLMGRDVHEVPPSIADIYVPLKLGKTPTSEERLPLEKPLGEHKHLVISGPPGSGKSTLVRYIGGSLGSPVQNEVTFHLGRMLPLPVILRGLDFDGVETPGGFLSALAAQYSRELDITVQPGLLKFYLIAGWGFFLFDGADEVDQQKRSKLQKLLKALNKLPHGKILLTGRPNGLAEFQQGIFAKTFYHVLPFDEATIRLFVEKWFYLRAPSQKEAVALSGIFLEALGKNKSLAELKTRPVYLTMLAVVHETLGRLPNTRAAAYKAMVTAYLHTLDAARKLKERGGSDVVPPSLEEDRRLILEHLAYRLHREAMESPVYEEGKTSYFPTERVLLTRMSKKTLLRMLRDIIGDLAQSQPNFSLSASLDENPELLTERMAAYFQYRTGFLVEIMPDTYQFSHLSFQEYLTARHIYRGQFTGKNRFAPIDYLKKELIRPMTDDAWHEVGQLFFAIDAAEGRGNQDDLLEALVPDPGEDSYEGFVVFWIKLISDGDHKLSQAYLEQKLSRLAALAQNIDDPSAGRHSMRRALSYWPEAWLTCPQDHLDKLLDICGRPPEAKKIRKLWQIVGDRKAYFSSFDWQGLLQSIPHKHDFFLGDLSLCLIVSLHAPTGLSVNVWDYLPLESLVFSPELPNPSGFRPQYLDESRRLISGRSALNLQKGRTEKTTNRLWHVGNLEVLRGQVLRYDFSLGSPIGRLFFTNRTFDWVYQFLNLEEHFDMQSQLHPIFEKCRRANSLPELTDHPVIQTCIITAVFFHDLIGKKPVTRNAFLQAQTHLKEPENFYLKDWRPDDPRYSFFLESHKKLFGPETFGSYLEEDLKQYPEELFPITWEKVEAACHARLDQLIEGS
ncbi:MAG: NACHT domain-containing protein [Acidobacteriota bacterium]|nr:NACHT domain-containing protein [Acidobacteriota bacterium]